MCGWLTLKPLKDNFIKIFTKSIDKYYQMVYSVIVRRRIKSLKCKFVIVVKGKIINNINNPKRRKYYA